MSVFFLKIINMSISASWLVLAIMLLRLALKKAPKWVFVLLWGFVAVRLICPFSVESVLSLIPSAEIVSPEIMMDRTPEISTGIGPLDAAVNPIITGSFAPKPYASANPLQIWIPVAAIVWVIGIAFMLVYTAVSYMMLRRKVAAAVLLRNNIYQSENVDSPFVLGVIAPKIYIPFRMDKQNLEHVIAHEMSHIRRKDHWWKPIGFLILTVHWFNPILWMGYALLCRDIELACDESVIKELDNASKADYSQALVDCSVNRRSIAACPLAFGEIGVKARVKAVLNYKKPAFWVIVAAVIACMVVAVCFLTNPKSVDDPDSLEDGYYLLIGTDGVKSIQVSGINASGGVINADGSAFKRGEKVWLEPLRGVTDLRGFSVKAMGGNGKILYALSIPKGATDSEVINLVSNDGWLLAPADFESNLSKRTGKTYVYENGGFMGSFIITLYDDGTFSYYEGSASSYFGTGTWTKNGDTITLNDDMRVGNGLTNRFKLDGDDLLFVEEGSSNFIYVKVKNGEKFYCTGEVAQNANSVDEPAQLGGNKSLSLDDVITLSKKGYDLGWSDFEEFRYYETGSGLYIRVYEIDEVFEVWIGDTANPVQDHVPMYIYLKLADDSDQKIDIRDGGVTEFITKHSSGLVEQWDLVPMIFVDGELYLDTGFNSNVEHADHFDGEITSQVNGSEMPAEDNQSNFGTGYGYQYGTLAGTIELYLNGKWRIYATEEVRQMIQFSSQYNDLIGIDKAIEKAILEHNDGDRFAGKPDGLIKAESHCILGISPQSGTPIIGQTNHSVETTAYVQYVYHRYAYSGDKLVSVAGISTPAMLTFSYDPEDGYELKEFWEPNGGSVFEEELRGKFPKDIADIVLDPKSDVMDTDELEAQCVAKAQKADIDALLSKFQDNLQGYVSDLLSQWE